VCGSSAQLELLLQHKTVPAQSRGRQGRAPPSFTKYGCSNRVMAFQTTSRTRLSPPHLALGIRPARAVGFPSGGPLTPTCRVLAARPKSKGKAGSCLTTGGSPKFPAKMDILLDGSAPARWSWIALLSIICKSSKEECEGHWCQEGSGVMCGTQGCRGTRCLGCTKNYLDGQRYLVGTKKAVAKTIWMCARRTHERLLKQTGEDRGVGNTMSGHPTRTWGASPAREAGPAAHHLQRQ
jgi:hypothetical protein